MALPAQPSHHGPDNRQLSLIRGDAHCHPRGLLAALQVTEEVLKLPPLRRAIRDFDVRLSPADVPQYVSEWEQMKRLRVQMATDAHGRGALLIALLAKLQKLRQLIVSPQLHALGATSARGDAAEQIAGAGSGFLDALGALSVELVGKHTRFVVVAESVAILQIAVACVRRATRIAWHGTYDGSLSQRRRDSLVKDFLGSSSGVLGLSLKAGGVGLNLVPGVTAMIMLSQSFSPAVPGSDGTAHRARTPPLQKTGEKKNTPEPAESMLSTAHHCHPIAINLS